MSEKKVRQWCRDFKNGRINVHDEERSGKPSRQTEEIVSLVDQKLQSNRRLTISALAYEFPNLERTIVYTIVTD
jgi:transposase